ncbi:ETS-related transcription factor [Takifugu flavidus]|uniref:ETS-related transcription factor n=1 Tax=Takifugu flavidus TaxID=433684 RepID=A0A5C6N0E4_9TELE|nr:ETS-related transcription factor [Takifugu flavidus]
MVPATAENGDKITVQLAKIITIPAHQLAQCQLQTSTGTSKSNIRASPAGIGVLGDEAERPQPEPTADCSGVAALQRSRGAAGVRGQPGRGGPALVISGVINGSELVIGGAAADKLKASGVHVHAVQVPVQQIGSKTLQNIQTEPIDAEVVIKVEAPDTMKTEEPEY